jgi:hypothetical protein
MRQTFSRYIPFKIRQEGLSSWLGWTWYFFVLGEGHKKPDSGSILILLLFPGRKTVSRTRLSTKPFFLPVFRKKREAINCRFVFSVLVLLKKSWKLINFFVLENLIRKPVMWLANRLQQQGIKKGNRTGHLCSWLVGYLYLLYALSHMNSYTPIPTFIHPSTITNLDTCSVHPVKGTVSQDGYFLKV